MLEECSIHVQCHLIPRYQTYDSHCQLCPMYGMCLKLLNHNWTTFTTHFGKMSLRWLTILNLGSDSNAVLFPSLLLSSRKIPGKALSKKIYSFPFEKNYFFCQSTLVDLTTTSVYFVHLLCMVCINNVGIHHNFHSGRYR